MRYATRSRRGTVIFRRDCIGFAAIVIPSKARVRGGKDSPFVGIDWSLSNGCIVWRCWELKRKSRLVLERGISWFPRSAGIEKEMRYEAESEMDGPGGFARVSAPGICSESLRECYRPIDYVWWDLHKPDGTQKYGVGYG